MQGMRFVLLGEKGIPLNHGQILQKVTEDRYLCQFARKPTVCRLCHVDEISTWNLFINDDNVNEFIASLKSRVDMPLQPAAPAAPADPIATIEPEDKEPETEESENVE